MHPFSAFLHARRRAACGDGFSANHAPFGEHGGHDEGPAAWGVGRGGPHGHGPRGFGGRGHGGPGGHGHDDGPHDGGGDEGGSFGVRRPLRFLAFKLELDEAQIAEIATVLSDLKTERAQSAVDQRRTTASFAEVVAGESFDEARARAAADDRVKSHERVQVAVVKALGRIHATLKPEQRATLAYLLRTGALSI